MQLVPHYFRRNQYAPILLSVFIIGAAGGGVNRKGSQKDSRGPEARGCPMFGTKGQRMNW